MSEQPKFRCNYTLDDRPDKDLVTLCQTSYRYIQRALGSSYGLSFGDDGLPNAVEYYVLYIASLLYGSADAALTLVLHNLGREARLFERQMFEYVTRAQYYIERPEEAKRYMLSTPFRERELLDELGYTKDSDRYRAVSKWCDEVSAANPDAATYVEPSLRSILGPRGDQQVASLYALRYRAHSQMAHGTIAGAGSVWSESGLGFDSRQEDPNLSLEAITSLTLTFLGLMNSALRIDIEHDLSVLTSQFASFQERLWAGRTASKEPAPPDE